MFHNHSELATNVLLVVKIKYIPKYKAMNDLFKFDMFILIS